MIRHLGHHAVVGVAVYLAGRAFSKRARAGWLLLAGWGFVQTARYHHGR